VILEESIIHLIKGAAWVAENFPDDSRLARRLLVAAGALLGAHSFLARWAGRDSIFLFQGLCLVAWNPLRFPRFVRALSPGGLVRQEKAGSGLTSLDLSQAKQFRCIPRI
jgi:hypothetical protein